MTMNTGNTAVDDVLNIWFNKDFVSDLNYMLQTKKFTEDAIVPKGQGNIARFFVLSEPARTGYTTGGSAAITEMTTTANEIVSLTTTSTDMTIAEFGEFIKVGSLYEYAAIDTMREKIRGRLADGAAVALDSFTHSKARQTTNIVYATAAQTGGVTTGPSAVTALGASTLILGRKVLVDGLCKGLSGRPGHPNGQFAAIITPKQELDITTEVTTLRVYWNQMVVNVPGVLGQEKAINGYIGSIYGSAVYVTNNYATTTYTSAVDIGYLLADGGIGSVNFKSRTPEIVVNDVNSPYKNVNSIAWHAFEAAALISSVRVVKLYSLS